MLAIFASTPSSRAFSIVLTSSAGYNSIFEGMQPRVRHIPPGSSLSMTAIRMSGFSWIIGSTMFIAEPVPIMIRSYCFMLKGLGVRGGDKDIDRESVLRVLPVRLWFLCSLDFLLAHDEDEDEYSEGEGCEADRHGDCDVEVESVEQLIVQICWQDHQRARVHDHYAP